MALFCELLKMKISKFYRRHYELISKNVCLKTLLREGMLEAEFNGDLFTNLRILIGRNIFFSVKNTIPAK